MLLKQMVGSRFVRLFAPRFAMEVTSLPRPMIQYIKDHLSTPLTGVEIGVQTARNAESILKTLNIAHLYLVDPYKPYVDADGKRCNPAKYFDLAKKKIRCYKDKVTWILKPSLEAHTNIPDNLHFVYIDGLHSYENVKEELKIYYEKIRVGGLIGGDNFEPRFHGVAKAVIEFMESKDLTLQGKSVEWFFVKK